MHKEAVLFESATGELGALLVRVEELAALVGAEREELTFTLSLQIGQGYLLMFLLGLML